jgi:hypothetical protein
MEITMRQPQASLSDDIVGWTVPLTINGARVGECLIKAVGKDGTNATVIFEVGDDSPVARAIAVGELREGSYSLGAVATRGHGDDLQLRQMPRIEFRLPPVSEPGGRHQH